MLRYAVILIAGTAQRWGQGDKCLQKIHGIPVAIYSLNTFLQSGLFEHCFLVYRSEEQKQQLQNYINLGNYVEKISWIIGGNTRLQSVFCALKYIATSMEPESFVFIHDGARPLITKENLFNLNDVLSKNLGAVLAHRVTDTTLTTPVLVTSSKRNYVDRKQLWALETPQAFYFPQLYQDYQRAIESGKTTYTDDTSVYSSPVSLVENNNPNIKLTYPQDLDFVEYYLSKN